MIISKEEDKYYSKNHAIKNIQKKYICEFEKFVKERVRKNYVKRKLQETYVIFPRKN